MSYAIVINLDYISFESKDCGFVWNLIKSNMLDAGFILDKRLLISKESEQDACRIARGVIEKLSRNPKLQGHDIFSYLNEFYGYDHSHTVNLLLPDESSFEVKVN